MASQLEELDLSFNEITSLEPLFLAANSFTSLKGLGVASCKLKHLVPEDDERRTHWKSILQRLDVFHYEFNTDLDKADVQEAWVAKVLQESTMLHTEIPFARDVEDAIRGCLYGQAVGDAVGLATEFTNKKDATLLYGIAPIEYKNYFHDRHRGRWVNGDYTDDTDQMLLIIDMLLNRQDGQVDQVDFANRLFSWVMNGYLVMSDDGGLGLGQTVRSVVTDFHFLSDPYRSSREVWERSGKKIAPNGAVMRTSVLGLLHYDNLNKVTEQTLAICKTTHFDPRCQASTVAICSTICLLLQNMEQNVTFCAASVDKIVTQAHSLASQCLPEEEDAHTELKKHIYARDFEELLLDEGSSIGYTYKAMGCAFVALRCVARGEHVESVFTNLVREAGDADSNACVAGAVMGAAIGYHNLPQRWISGLVHGQWFEQRVNRVLDLIRKTITQ